MMYDCNASLTTLLASHESLVRDHCRERTANSASFARLAGELTELREASSASLATQQRLLAAQAWRRVGRVPLTHSLRP